MSSNNSTPRLKLSGKHLVGFDTGRAPADGTAEAGAAAAKVGAVKLGAPKPGVKNG
jgi:hypothetical protein